LFIRFGNIVRVLMVVVVVVVMVKGTVPMIVMI